LHVIFSEGLTLFFFKIFAGDVVFGHFVGYDFSLVWRRRILHALHQFRIKGVPFFDQFFHALRIRPSDSRKPLKIA